MTTTLNYPPVPYVSQIDAAPDKNDCGIAAALMMLRWLNLAYDHDVNYWGDIVDPTHNGTTAADLNRMFVAYGVHQVLDGLAALPFIDLVWYGLLPSRYYPSLRSLAPFANPGLDYDADMKAGVVRSDEWAESGMTIRATGLSVKHWIVVLSNVNGVVTYHDPLYPTTGGANKNMTAAQLAACEVYPGRARLGMVERPAVGPPPDNTGSEDMATYRAKADSGGARMRFAKDIANNSNIAGTWPVGPTFEGDADGEWIKVKAQLTGVKIGDVDVPPSGVNPRRIVDVFASTAVVELAKPPPIVPPITPPTPAPMITAAKLFGVHELGGKNKAAEALARGCRAVMCFESATGAYQLATQYPDAIVMHRKYFKYQMAPAELLAQHGINVNESSDSTVWYRSFNENDVQGIDSSVNGIRDRARFDVECATLLKRSAPRAKWVAGGFAHGNPDYTNQAICDAMREYYAPHYNSGLFVFDCHNYTKPAPGASPKDYKTIAPIWLKRNWEFLFTKCGFNPNVRAIVHSEAGHECGFGGMNAAGFTVPEFADWCDWTWQVQTAPLVIGGVSYPSPVLCECGFQYGDDNSGSGGWAGYSLNPYIGHMDDRWNKRVTLARAMRLPGGGQDELWIYDGVPAASADVPPKDMSEVMQ